MSGRLAGKVAAITGASSGIGAATARLFAAEGASVHLLDVNEDAGKQLASSVGGDFHRTDVTVESDVAAALGQASKLDILVACAGGSVPEDGPITEADLGVFDRTFRLDVLGTMHSVRHAVPLMAANGGGSIVTFSSSAALLGYVPWHIYSSAKGAIISLTQAVAGQYAAQGIRANAIAPGLVKTGRVHERQGNGNAAMKVVTDRYDNYPFGVGEAADIANIALFLASDESRMLTGEVLGATGGLSRY
ncbi:SDR family oxidoreductase [Actinoplanes bogorensis]|uniref:SDR family oxidoreductase n=1 Tax=Paractinoplanes bogorensis TaxID=1610840 RepID=A0ABS5YUS1_9ACTN|nr:SDR family oxidoreductase [Actinoplanes bogorensis]MBU2667196.1 SDR family oxidoreductase [Actinoplanes bogorensis]